MNMPICDVLIIGSGIAGLSLAIKLCNQFPDKKIYVITKDCEAESNTRYAQGGISVVCDYREDSFDKHIEDTLKAGDDLCNREIVEKVIRHGPQALADLIGNGVAFDRGPSGELLLGMEGGHSRSRIVHYKDMTGFQVVVSLLAKLKTLPQVSLLPHCAAIDLITDRNLGEQNNGDRISYGAFVLNKKTKVVERFLSRITVLATGGVGQLYKTTTNPSIATGDGIAMAHRAGARIENMEFIQFHPTALFLREPGAPCFLVSEAVRGCGAYLRNSKGDRFMFRYSALGELACRDVVSRAIANEIENGGHPCVYLDCRHLPSDVVVQHFPKIYGHCLDRGIDITKELIPVIPAAHYLCGGIVVNSSGMSSIQNVYALGECSSTGLHGANRLASNSLLEAVAFSEFCFQDIREKLESIQVHFKTLKISYEYPVTDAVQEILSLKEEVQRLMSKYVGISRTTGGLAYAHKHLKMIAQRLDEICPQAVSPEILALRNMIACAHLIVLQSLDRKTNKGVFYNRDLDLDYAHNFERREDYG